MTPIDTAYEYAGFKLAGMLREILGSVGLPLILGLAGVAYVIHLVTERGSIKDLAVYLFYIIFVWWLLSPTKLQDISTPRFVAYLGQGTDLLQKRAARAVNKRFLDSPFEWERVAAMVSFGRILDPALGRDAAEFLEACAKPALARAEPRSPNLFREGALPYVGRCEELRKGLWRRIEDHVQKDPYHRSVIDAARKRDPAQGSAFQARYLEEVAVRAVDDPESPTGEMNLVLASLGEYSYTDPAQSVGTLPGWAMSFLGVLGLVPGGHGLAERALNAAISGAAVFHQSWENRFTAKQQYYLATVYGPAIYGLSLMLVIGLFPVAGLFALLPGKWGVLVRYGEVFVSIKLWPVCWAALSTFNARRSSLEAFEPGGRSTTEVWLAVAAMYLLTPAFAYLVVHLATAAARLPFAQAAPAPAGPGIGPAGAVVKVAAAAAR